MQILIRWVTVCSILAAVEVAYIAATGKPGKEVTQTRRVTSDDLVILLGKHKRKTEYGKECVAWWEQQTDTGEVEYAIAINDSTASPGRYEVILIVKTTYRRGATYIYMNMARAIKSGILFPMEPYLGVQHETLYFEYLK